VKGTSHVSAHSLATCLRSFLPAFISTSAFWVTPSTRPRYGPYQSSPSVLPPTIRLFSPQEAARCSCASAAARLSRRNPRTENTQEWHHSVPLLGICRRKPTVEHQPPPLHASPLPPRPVPPLPLIPLFTLYPSRSSVAVPQTRCGRLVYRPPSTAGATPQYLSAHVSHIICHPLPVRPPLGSLLGSSCVVGHALLFLGVLPVVSFSYVPLSFFCLILAARFASFLLFAFAIRHRTSLLSFQPCARCRAFYTIQFRSLFGH